MGGRSGIVLAVLTIGIIAWLIDAAFVHGQMRDASWADAFQANFHSRLLFTAALVALGAFCVRSVSGRDSKERDLFERQLLDSIPAPVFYKDADYIYTGCNRAFEEFLGMGREEIIGKSVYDIAPKALADVYHEKDAELMNNPGVQVYEFEVKSRNSEDHRQVVFHKATFHDSDGKVAGLIGVILDITERKRAEKRNEKLIRELRQALEEVRELRGLIPICASCKSIRDDQGYWQRLEAYFQEHSDVQFSHSICPECAQKLYPDLDAGAFI
ncbi:MAG: PAS domain S-box protein [Gammaproteobacteria bacterium]|nr:MAG: PAS domain S-box protein [Gammaproteobacteria bacterium]